MLIGVRHCDDGVLAIVLMVMTTMRMCSAVLGKRVYLKMLLSIQHDEKEKFFAIEYIVVEQS